MKNNNNNSVEANSTLLPSWATSERPWDEARKLKIVRHDYRKNEIIDPGVNFFVLVLEALGAQPKYSCEGHPNGFYILFKATYDLAMAIEKQGYFSVELSSRTHGKNWWCIHIRSEFANERDKRRVLRWAAASWLRAFCRVSESSDMKK